MEQLHFGLIRGKGREECGKKRNAKTKDRVGAPW